MPYYPNTHSAKQKSPALSRAFEIVARPRGFLIYIKNKILSWLHCNNKQNHPKTAPTIRKNQTKNLELVALLPIRKNTTKMFRFRLQIQHFCCIISSLYKKGGGDEIQ